MRDRERAETLTRREEEVVKRMHALAITALVGGAIVLVVALLSSLPSCERREPSPTLGSVFKLGGC